MDITIVASGLCFPEGPVWMNDGSVIVTEVGAGVITRVRPDGQKETVAECGGGPNGAAVGPDGFLYVCNNGGMICYQEDSLLGTKGEAFPDYDGGWIDRINVQTGNVERLYESVDGQRLAGPNDIVFDDQGGFWFSDLGKQIGPRAEGGGIYYARPDGSFIERVVDGQRVNGIGISPDGKTLYGALSFEASLVAYEISKPGVLGPGGLAGGRPIAQFKPEQHPDSLAIDSQGNVCVALCMISPGIGSVNVEAGSILDHPFEDRLTTNICFGGSDMRDAWVTLSTTGRLAKVRWDIPGLRLAHYA